MCNHIPIVSVCNRYHHYGHPSHYLRRAMYSLCAPRYHLQSPETNCETEVGPLDRVCTLHQNSVRHRSHACYRQDTVGADISNCPRCSVLSERCHIIHTSISASPAFFAYVDNVLPGRLYVSLRFRLRVVDRSPLQTLGRMPTCVYSGL